MIHRCRKERRSWNEIGSSSSLVLLCRAVVASYSLPYGELAEDPLRNPGELGTPRFIPALP